MGALPFCAVIKRPHPRPDCKVQNHRAHPHGVLRCDALTLRPHDVLLTILQQGLGPRELCRLEQCSKQRELVDEQIWRGAFRRRRRANALRDPSSWKQVSTRGVTCGRATGGSSSSATAAGLPRLRAIRARRVGAKFRLHTQKLRRFALKMMAAANPGRRRRARRARSSSTRTPTAPSRRSAPRLRARIRSTRSS